MRKKYFIENSIVNLFYSMLSIASHNLSYFRLINIFFYVLRKINDHNISIQFIFSASNEIFKITLQFVT